MADDWMTVAEASKQSGYSPVYLQELAREGRVKAKKIVTIWLVSRSSLTGYLREQEKRGEKRGRKPSSASRD